MTATEKPKSTDEPLVLTVQQFCRKFNISRTTVYKYEKLGKIRLVRALGRTLIPLAEARRLLGEEA